MLIGRAVLPAETFAEGPPSGSRLGDQPRNGVPVPFPAQPLQGLSGVVDNRDGTFWALVDNGYGGLVDSADFHLRLYRLRPDFQTAGGGTGSITVVEHVELRDPDRRVAFPIRNHFSDERVLTGADFDPESLQRAPDGTLWIGDEFGPFLLHVDDDGILLEPPIPLPDFDNPGRELRSPQSPYQEERFTTVRLMNAVAAHAVAHGGTLPPVVSPWHLMLADRNPATVVPSRQTPPPESGLVPASSEIHDVGILQRAGFPVVPYTVNDPARMTELLDLGVDGLISDDPAALYDAIARYDADGDGFGGDYLLPDGRPDLARVDAQGQRGGRDLRPENTLPAMEVALDHQMTTLELDVGVTADKLPILSHDPVVAPEKCRRANGGAVPADGTLIRDLTAAELQAGYVCDVLLPDHPRQTNDRALSPVSQAFAAERGLVDPYVPPTLAQVYGFIGFYEHWYATGPGRAHPDAAVRAATAAAIRLNVETRLNPRTAYDQRTLGPDAVTAAVLDTVRRAGAVGRTSLQSLDWRTLLTAQEREPALQTVYLFGDFPAFDDPGVAGSGEGENLQGEHGTTSPWLAGLSWPYRVTTLSYPDRVRGTGGLEGTAITTDGSVILAMLEKPLDGDPTDLLWIHEFSMSEGSFTGRRFGYRLDPRGVSAGDFQLVSDTTGLVVERDASEGDLTGHKAVYEILLSAPGFDVAKRRVVDLLALANPDGVGGAGAPGDVGLGEPFAFPFATIESVIVLGPDRIAVLNDNNFPDSVGRHVGARRPDDNEFIVVQLAQPLATP